MLPKSFYTFGGIGEPDLNDKYNLKTLRPILRVIISSMLQSQETIIIQTHVDQGHSAIEI